MLPVLPFLIGGALGAVAGVAFKKYYDENDIEIHEKLYFRAFHPLLPFLIVVKEFHFSLYFVLSQKQLYFLVLDLFFSVNKSINNS